MKLTSTDSALKTKLPLTLEDKRKKLLLDLEEELLACKANPNLAWWVVALEKRIVSWHEWQKENYNEKES